MSHSHHRLPNYVRASRKKAGLSQEDLAFLLGCECGTLISRYELFRRQPTLPTVFALEAVFGIPARELFAGVYEKAEQQTAERARSLIRRLERQSAGRRVSRKLAVLNAVVESRSLRAGDGTPRP